MPSNIGYCCYAKLKNCSESNPEVIRYSNDQGKRCGNYLNKISPKMHTDPNRVAHYSCYSRVNKENIRSNYSKIYLPAAFIAGILNGDSSSCLRNSDSPYGKGYNAGEGFTGKGDAENPANQFGRNLRKATDVMGHAYGISSTEIDKAIKAAQSITKSAKQFVQVNSIVSVDLGKGISERRFIVGAQALLKDKGSDREYVVIENGDRSQETQWVHQSSSGYKYIIV